jgi:hypothetical protein
MAEQRLKPTNFRFAGESFDRYKTFIFRDAEGCVCILVQDSEGAMQSARCESSAFRPVSQAFVTWYDSISAPSGDVVRQTVEPDRREDAAPG